MHKIIAKMSEKIYSTKIQETPINQHYLNWKTHQGIQHNLQSWSKNKPNQEISISQTHHCN